MMNLTRLYLGRNRLRTLPQSLSKLSSMQELRVDRNHLTHFPTCILSLHSMRRLSLSHNKIDRLPSGINRLIGLTELSVDNNKVSGLGVSGLEMCVLSRLRGDSYASDFTSSSRYLCEHASLLLSLRGRSELVCR